METKYYVFAFCFTLKHILRINFHLTSTKLPDLFVKVNWCVDLKGEQQTQFYIL